jgi:hypothetical protein
MTQQIPFETLLDYAEGRLGETEQATVAARLQSDPAASAALVEAQRLIALMRADAVAGEDAPPHVIQRASRLLRQRKSSAPAAPGLLRRLVAVLTHDSAASPALGLRAGAADVRQLLYSAEWMDVDVRITLQGGNFVVSGQVLGPESTGLVALSGDATQAESPLNDLGEFALPAVPAGRYTLTLRISDAEVAFPALELGASTLNP